jgi:hypothetical protein
MKAFLLALIAFIPLAAHAASPEESYLASKKRYVEKFKKLEDAEQMNDRALKEEERARLDLEKQLREVVGPLALKGFSGPGKISLETLFSEDVGANQLDGLVYSSDDNAQAVVTTESLLQSWLRARKPDWPNPKAAPTEIPQALKSEDFYTLALSSDAAVSKYAEILLEKPANAAFAFALLDARSQDTPPRIPNELIVSVVREGKVFLTTAPAKAKIDSIPACDKISQEYESKASKARAAYNASNPKNEKLFDESTRFEREGDASYRRCFAEQAKNERFFRTLTDEAQSLLDRLSSK